MIVSDCLGLVPGADEGNRTSDLRITNALLYQLSYIGDLIDGVNYKVLQPLQQTNLLVKAESGVRANQCLSEYPATPIIKRTRPYISQETKRLTTWLCCHSSTVTRRAPVSMDCSRSSRSSVAKPVSATTILASRASSRLNGSILDEPTVAQCWSITATLQCMKLL